MDAKKVWDNLRKPPKDALKKIQGGRLKGMTDISPQWRIEAITEQFGLCGEGWRYDIIDMWTIPGAKEELMCFAKINFFYKLEDGKWSHPITGVGGSKLITLEKEGQSTERLYNNDEGYKMAITDALGTAMKCVGLAADVYLNNMDGSKYREQSNRDEGKGGKDKEGSPPKPSFADTISELRKQMKEDTYNEVLKSFNVANITEITNRETQVDIYTALTSKIKEEKDILNAEIKNYFEIMEGLKADLTPEVYHEALKGIGMKNAADKNASKNRETRRLAVDTLQELRPKQMEIESP